MIFIKRKRLISKLLQEFIFVFIFCFSLIIRIIIVIGLVVIYRSFVNVSTLQELQQCFLLYFSIYSKRSSNRCWESTFRYWMVFSRERKELKSILFMKSFRCLFIYLVIGFYSKRYWDRDSPPCGLVRPAVPCVSTVCFSLSSFSFHCIRRKNIRTAFCYRKEISSRIYY